MRYWAFFAAKLIVAGGVFYALLALLNPLVPPARNTHPAYAMTLVNPNAATAPQKPATSMLDDEGMRKHLAGLEDVGAYLAINTALMVWFVLAAGSFYWIVRDQRFRCRVCLRRLRMPVETGSRGFMLQLGRPRIEYICVYGHGTLKKEEYETSELENPKWTESSGDIWEDLYAASKNAREK